MSCIKCLQSSLFMVFCLNVSPNFGQENFTAFWQPSAAVNYDVTPTYAHNFSIQNRNFIHRNQNTELTVRHIDIAHFSKLDIKGNQSLALGILYRFREVFDGGANELRLTQQYNLQSKPHVIRFGHRFRSEQRIIKVNTIYRFRYRYSLDFPLQGEKLDVGEAYFVGNIEKLLSVSSSKPQYDARFTVHFGWKLTQKAKLQIGSEYRLEDYSQNLQQLLFFMTGLNLSL